MFVKTLSALVALALVAACLVPVGAVPPKSIAKPNSALYGPDEVCNLCLQSMVQWINELLNEGIGEGTQDCHELCDYVKKGYERDLCDYTCGMVGLAALMELLQDDGKDIIGLMIYGCEEIYACPLQDCTGSPCFVINQYKVHPPVGYVGDTFKHVANVTCLKTWTGTGLIDVVVTFPDGSTFEYGDLLMTGGLEPAGDTMLVPIDVHASVSHNYVPGEYTATFYICNGQCGGIFPHDATLATATAKFKILPNTPVEGQN